MLLIPVIAFILLFFHGRKIVLELQTHYKLATSSFANVTHVNAMNGHVLPKFKRGNCSLQTHIA